jgi:ubiquinone/menaquinone biosynthesis C-methylase UbiE
MITPERTSKEQFDRQATHYDTNWNSWSKETLDWLVENSDAGPTDQVLDVATGTGFTALAFAPLVHGAVGLDVSEGMLDEARKQALHSELPNVDFVEGAAEDMPFDDATFDIVTCRIAAHHFVNIDSFASEANRVLKSGGRLVIADTSVPDGDFLAAVWQNEVERLRDLSHAKNYTMREWQRILDRAGFRVVSISDSGSGIRIPLSDWIFKAGCTLEQAAEVRKRFADAPANVRRQFKIEEGSDGQVNFTWLRVLIKALKSDFTEGSVG